MLQHTRCFFNNSASVFWARIEHRVNLALADDHVLLTANACVRQQFLHVEQTALHAIDCVFAFAAAEQNAADGYFRKFDWQQTCRVVDGQHYFRAAKCRALRRARENNVVHLLASHRTWCLGAKHPRNGIHHVGFARTVWPHHNGDTWFELHHRGICKGLEALEG